MPFETEFLRSLHSETSLENITVSCKTEVMCFTSLDPAHSVWAELKYGTNMF